MIRQYTKRLNRALKALFAPKGLVGPHMTQKDWDEQFANGKWAYLSDADQREHYDCIIDLYKHYGNNGVLLDIGCGVGLLYRYFMDTKTIKEHQYLGIDISAVAIAEAIDTCKTENFRVVDYQTEKLDRKFDVIVFNETLYYFNHAGKTLQKCTDENLNPGGIIIISMCDHERHDLIWQLIDKQYKIAATAKSANSNGISWTIKVILAE